MLISGSSISYNLSAFAGCKGQTERWPILKKLFESENFRINVTEDANTVELCGGLKVGYHSSPEIRSFKILKNTAAKI